jgi:hypothetical protein
MSDLPRAAHDQGINGHSGELTRRTVIAGVVATTVATAVIAVDMPANAQSANVNPSEDLILFVLLSAALTGISEAKLATGFGPKAKLKIPKNEIAQFIKNLKQSDLAGVNVGSDPVGIKRAYFDWVNARHPAPFRNLLRITKDSVGASDRWQSIIDRVQSSGEKYLARSIVLMWYLGGWYDPEALEKTSKSPGPPPDFKVISPEAYTQGWALKVARAHPMGFSQLPFGYWTREPSSLDDFIG